MTIAMTNAIQASAIAVQTTAQNLISDEEGRGWCSWRPPTTQLPAAGHRSGAAISGAATTRP